ncbi:MAG: AMP-binding protein [Desulfosarcinaceae bacterium]|nr:AMP-binding protein [Desulfosarcinaceae bacterium]
MEGPKLIASLNRRRAAGARYFCEEVTFQHIHRMADRLAVQMRSAAGGKPVCLCCGDRAVVAAALLAGLRTGIPLILPHAHSAPTLKALHREFPFAAAVVGRTDAPALPPEVITLRTDAAPAPDPASETGDVAGICLVGVDDPWVYLFTGGSTGRPKIWTKTPTNLLAETDYLARRFGVTPTDRILATAPPHHIYGLLYGVLLPLLSGAWVSAATPVFPHEILAALKNTQATILVSLPVHYRSLRHLPFGDHRLRMAFSSTGPLDPADGEAFSTATGAPLYEIYGSTETGGIASRCRQAGETGLTPFAPVTVDITASQAAVRSTFISPDLPRDQEGRFILADRLETAADGSLVLRGRNDGIVKVGGTRVDMTLVKELLMVQPGVSDAVVFKLPGSAARGAEIVAVVEGDVQAGVLREVLTHALEPQALPRRMKIVDRMPMLATGKYDRQALQRLF